MNTNDKFRPLVLGFIGKAKSGKDTAANDFQELMDGIVPIYRKPFAGPIREIGKLFGYTMEQMTDQSLKETYCNKIFPLVTPRKFMQLVGSEMSRNNLDKDSWVKLVKNFIEGEYEKASHYVTKIEDDKYHPSSIVMVTDVRFPNEAAMIKEMGGYLIKITRPSLSQDGADWHKHESEAYIDTIEADFNTVNDMDTAVGWGRVFSFRIVKWLEEQGWNLNIDKERWIVNCPS